MDLGQFMSAKKSGAIVRDRKGLQVRPNGRSSDFIIPSFAIGCPLVCAYCNISRHRAFGNPVEYFYNVEEIWEATRRHWLGLPGKTVPNQCDPVYWTYDIGESTDALAKQNIQVTNWFIEKFLLESRAKPTFATKLANDRYLPNLSIDLTYCARVRVSLMPEAISKVVEPVTSPVAKRIAAINPMVSKGYEVHINFSPVIITDDWQKQYVQLFKQIDQELSFEAKRQLKCEVIFLTHHPRLHESNLAWAPEAEQLLWRPELQETKTNERGDNQVLRYRAFTTKRAAIESFKLMLQQHLPYCEIRYIF